MEILIHIPYISCHKCLQLVAEIRHGAIEFFIVFRLHILVGGFLAYLIQQLLRYDKLLVELIERVERLLQLLSVVIDISQHDIRYDALCHELTVVFGIRHRVERHEVVWHDASATIDDSVFSECIILQRVGEMYTVGIRQLTVLQPLLKVHSIVLGISLLVWLLYASARRRVVMGYGKTNH